jgi:glycosyltransferase involved in cell wall biosynthesis
VDPQRFAIGSHPRNNKALEVAFVGRLVPYKGAENLIRAAAPFAKAHQLRVHIFGDGPQREQLSRLITSEGLADQILLHGWVDHQSLHGHLRNCDVFAFPSMREFGGAVVLEAMACGTVPIIVDYAGPSELVTEQTGFKVPLSKPEELVRSYSAVFQSILNNMAMLEPMRLAGVERVRQHFTWEAKARKVIEVYRWVLGLRRTNPEEDINFLSCEPSS